MAGIRKSGGRQYARSFYRLNKKQVEIRVPLQNPNEPYITKYVAESRKTRYEKKYEAEVINNHIKGKKLDTSKLDWFSDDAIKYKENSVILKQAVDRWLAYVKSERLEENTIGIYKRHMWAFMEVIGETVPVKSLKTSHIDAFKISQQSVAIATLHSKLRTIDNFFGFCVDRSDDYGLIAKPKVKKPTLPKGNPMIISNNQFFSALNEIDKIYSPDRANFLRSIYNFYRDTGLRLSEPFNFELFADRIRIKAGRTKNSYPRNVYLTKDQVLTIERMRSYVDSQVKQKKSRVNQIKYFSRIWKNVLRKTNAPEKINFHSLRDTFATRLYFLTGDIYKVCGALGHSDIKMTTKYTHNDTLELVQAFPDIAKRHNREQNGHQMMDTTALSSLQTDSQSDNFTRVNAGVV